MKKYLACLFVCVFIWCAPSVFAGDGSPVLEGKATSGGITIGLDGTITTQRSALPSISFRDLNGTDSDVNGIIYGDLTDTGSGTEDFDMFFRQQIAGSMATWLFADASGDTEFQNHDVKLDQSNGEVLKFNDGTDETVIGMKTESGETNSELVIGLDENRRALVLCDAGDVDADFGLGASDAPALYIFDDETLTQYLRIDKSSITAQSQFFFETNTDPIAFRLSSDNSYSSALFRFISLVNAEFTDTDGEQSWVYIEPKINQSGTAAYNALEINVTETALGDGSTGTGATNNLIVAGTSGDPDIFKVTNGGMLHTKPETVTCVTEAGTASANVRTSLLVTDGDADADEDTVSLADGTVGDEKVFVYSTETDAGDSVNVTPATALGFTKILFEDPGDGCIMVYTSAGWAVVSNNGGTLS